MFGSGYLANTGVIPALAGPDDLILVDELSHACIHAGAKLSGATVQPYRHADPNHAASAAGGTSRAPSPRAHRDRRRVLDGRRPRAARASSRASRSATTPGCWPTTPMASASSAMAAARALPTAPPTCRCRWAPCRRRSAPTAAIFAHRKPVIDLMRTRARTFIYSTGLPPPVVAAAIAALDLIEREPAYAAEPLRKARLFTRALNLPEAQSAIVPVIIGESRCGACRIRTVAARRLPCRRDQAADGARRHRPAPLRLHRAASRRRG